MKQDKVLQFILLTFVFCPRTLQEVLMYASPVAFVPVQSARPATQRWVKLRGSGPQRSGERFNCILWGKCDGIQKKPQCLWTNTPIIPRPA